MASADRWRRAVAAAGGVLVAGLALACGAAGTAWPLRPVRLILPYPPGGATDLVARTLAQKFTETFGQQFVVDNRAGAAQVIGTELAARAAPDGHTIILVSVTHSINPSLFAKLPYDSIADFAPIAPVGISPNVLYVHPSVAARSVKDLIALARANPGKLNLASSGNGSGGHLAAEYFKMLTGITMNHIPYKGGGPAYVDLLAGQVDLMFTSPAGTLQHARAGRLRALAITGAKRSPIAPDLPTIAEAAALPGYEASLWYGLLAPAKVPPAILDRLSREAVRIGALPEVREKFASQGIDPLEGGAREFAAHIRAEMDKWSKVIRSGNIRPAG